MSRRIDVKVKGFAVVEDNQTGVKVQELLGVLAQHGFVVTSVSAETGGSVVMWDQEPEREDDYRPWEGA